MKQMDKRVENIIELKRIANYSDDVDERNSAQIVLEEAQKDLIEQKKKAIRLNNIMKHNYILQIFKEG